MTTVSPNWIRHRLGRSWLAALCLSLVLGVANDAKSEIYKWQDDQGKWHFSDSPRSADKQPGVIRGGVQSVGEVAQPGVSQDLKLKLEQRFRPASTVERVTLAVVGIETHLGEGSGFFVSDDGHIITNKHVIRPAETEAWQESRQQFELGRERLEAFQGQLDEERRSLDDYALQLKRYRDDVQGRSEGSAKNTALAEYESYEQRYQKRLQAYLDQQAEHELRMREFERSYSDFSLKGSMAGAARQFKVILKDSTKLVARLLKISPGHDLALLKLDGYTTPKLDLAAQPDLRQGREVFAVGSPLGMKDAVTSGIITSLKRDYLVTDARILPGNSGGPLLDLESGEVLGVNTLKFARNVLSDGFGFAIPAGVVKQEFSSLYE